jgi:7-carboxy-7-deazaguanine synthase
MQTIEVAELFTSLQGESSWAGLPCAFVRLSGCPLSCRWCDTAWARAPGRSMEVAEAVAWAAGQGLPLAEVTGGEPLAQPGAPDLISALCGAVPTVLVETNGCEDIGAVDPRARVILDVKCPSSGMAGRTRWQNLALVREVDEVKFVLAGRGDYDHARAVIAEHGLAGRTGLLLSPVPGELEPGELAAWMLADRLPARLQLQLHKLIWGAEARGV